MIGVAIVAPSPLVRAELRGVVAGAHDLQLRCETDTVASLRATLTREPELHVDVAIVDRRLAIAVSADGREPLLEALEADLRLVLLGDAGAARMLPLVSAGATWLAGAASATQIVAAVRAAAAGLIALQPERFGELQDDMRRRAAAAERRAIERIEPLTARERQVLERLAAGRGNRLLASDLGISEHTAKFHVSRILGKLAAATRAEAVAIGLREGIIDTA